MSILQCNVVIVDDGIVAGKKRKELGNLFYGLNKEFKITVHYILKSCFS